MIREAHLGGGLWQITLARPEKANALTAAMLTDLCKAFETHQDAAAVILTGEGRVFSAGADLEEARAGLSTSPLWERLSGAVAATRGLTVAALNGTLAGGAMGMVLACDLRVAVPVASFFYPVMKLGFLPQPSDPARMEALIGPAKTRMILLAGQRIGAEEALAWGLLDRIAEDDVVSAARQLCEAAVAAGADHAASVKTACAVQR